MVEWNAGAEADFGWTRAEMLGTFVADTFLPGPFAKSPFGLLVADTTGAAAGPRDRRRSPTARSTWRWNSATGTAVGSATEARLVVLGHGRDRSVAAFLRRPTEQAPPPGRGAGAPVP